MTERDIHTLSPEQFEECTIAELQAAMAAGKLTSVQIVLRYLTRIGMFDKSGPVINAVLEVNPDALQIAEALDVERSQQGPRGPLHGIPILLKDNIDTADKLHTSAGSLALANSYAREDSFVAAQLRKAGAVILGKVNMTEWANFMTENMPNGYSSRGGQVKNPYGPGVLDTGGSSAGSGASIAANFAAVAIGTETSGSILSPASQNMLVGIKPTVGLISRTGIIPIAHSQDTAGPMTRTVADAATLLGALTGVDERDAATRTSPSRSYTDYTQFLKADGLHGVRFGVPRKHFYYEHMSESQLAIMDAAIAALRALGAEVEDNIVIDAAAELHDYNVLVYEFKPDLNAYLSNLDAKVAVHSLQEVIAFNEAQAEVALKYGQTVMVESQATSGTLTEAGYIESRTKDLRLAQTEGIDAVMANHRFDALLFPANFGAGIAAKAGYPSITVPGGRAENGEPLGVTFTAGAYSEPKLLHYAYAFEQATKHRVPPTLQQSPAEA